MILIGQYDSPFVRRVAIAMRRYEIPYEHRPWSTFGDADKIATYSPLMRVPTLVLDDGVVLNESWAILQALDARVGPERALWPGPDQRNECLRVMALATGFADKSVSLFLETFLRSEPSSIWIERCKKQIAGALDVLDADRASRGTSWWFGGTLTHADIAVSCALGHLKEAHPGFFDTTRWPALAKHAARTDALDDFKTVYQPFVVARPK